MQVNISRLSYEYQKNLKKKLQDMSCQRRICKLERDLK